MTITEALENALAALESSGYTTGDIHDDLAIAIRRLKRECPHTMSGEL